MKKLLTLLLLATLLAGNSYAQFISYGFQKSTGTYTEITGGTVLGTTSSDDQKYVDPATPAGVTTNPALGPGFPIGFNFVFNGITYDRFGVNNNGWMTLGQSALGASAVSIESSYTPISNSSTTTPAAIRGRIAAFARDLQSQTGASISFTTIGTAPNRTLVVQFKNYKRYGTNGTGDNLNFQIRLNETTNMVDIAYGAMATTGTASTTVEVGLGGNANSEFISRTSTNSWDETYASTINSGSLTYSSSIIPASGLTYTFGPMAPWAANLQSPSNGAEGMPLNVSLQWTANQTGGGAPAGYRVYMGTDNPPTNVANGTDVGNVLTYTAPAALNTNTVYNWQVVPYNNVGTATGNETRNFTTMLGFGDLEGFTTNGFGIPVGGVNVNLSNGVVTYNATSAADGSYEFNNIGAGPYTLTATLASYNNTVLTVSVAPATTTFQNVVMTRPSMAVTPNPYSVSVNPGEYVNGGLNIANNGDGILGWTATVNYTSPAPNSWLTLSQTTGTVNPYTNVSLPMALNATGLAAGTVKTAEITLTSTPNVGTVVIPVTMTVSGTALTSPANFVATLSNPVNGVVNLSWTFQSTPSFQYFAILRDGAQIATTTANNFTNTLPAYGVYTYGVQAVYAEGNSVPAGPATIEWANPTLVLAPTSLFNEQYPNSSENVTFRLSNTGEGTLAYSFPEYANRGAGGPDAFGYIWVDSDEQGGPTYAWTDISATGTAITGFSDDNVLGPFPIGFSFPFYGNTYSSVNVSSNGYLIFNSTSSSLSNQDIPSADDPNNIIAWAWDDLHGAGTGSTVHYQNMGDHWVIQFTNYHEYPSTGTGTITAQVHLYNNGNIKLLYNNLAGGFDVSSATVGIENADGTIATKVNYNSAYLHNNMAIDIMVPIPTFITAVSPAAGTVAPGSYVDVTATFTSDDVDFPVGTHTSELELTTNDLANSTVMVPATMVVYNPGSIAGMVTSAIDGSPIQGAQVTAGQYSVMTNEDGMYTIVADAGTYTLNFSKTGFTSETVADVVVTATQTATVNAELEEIAYPVTLVHAEVNEADTQAEVSWGAPTPEYEILYDNGTAENYTAWALPGNVNAVKFTPAGYPATMYGGKVYVGDGSFPNNNTGFLGTTFSAVVYDDNGTNGLPGTTLDSIVVTVDNLGWVSFSGLEATIEDGSFYLGMVQHGASPNVAPVGVDTQVPVAYRSYSRNAVAGQPWGLSPYQDLMIRALVSGPASDDAAKVAMSTEVRSALKQRAMISMYPAAAQSGMEGAGEFRAVKNAMVSRDVTGYSVWRIAVANPDAGVQSGVQTLINSNVSTNEYTDNAFGSLPEGWFGYAVAANYTNGGQSAKAYSNIVGHKKLVNVTVNVSLTTSGSPAGAVVTLTGSDYPTAEYSLTVPENGTVVFEDVWKGNYTLLAEKVGFDDYVITPNIQSNRTFDIVLAEKKYMPRNLYVDPLTLVATWDEPLAVAVMEDFEGATFPPAGWDSYTQNTNGWYATTDGSSSYFVIPPHTKYAVANDDEANGDGCCDIMWTPAMDWTDLPSYRLNYASYFTGEYGQTSTIEISTDNGNTWTVISNIEPNPAGWADLEIDLSSYSGASGLDNVMVAFHTNDNGEYASGWAVDDVQIASGGVPFQGYGVFLDGTLIGNTNETTYTYTNLNFGQTYMAGVAALFSSGYSELDTYRFTSTYLVPPTNLQGESPAETDYAHLTWEAPTGGGGAGGSLFEDFETGVLGEDWEIIQTCTGSNATPAYWTVNDYTSADFAPYGTYHAGLWWYEGHQDEWLITPEVNIGANTVLTFETTVYEGSTYNDHYYVKISTDGGATWTPVWDASELTGNGWNYYDYNYTVDLSAFAGESAKIAFQAVDGDGAGIWYIWFVDNISIGDATDAVSFRGNQLERVSKSENTAVRSNDQIARDGNTQRVTNHNATRASMGLIGYNVYRDEAIVDYVEAPTTEYFDLNMTPGTYSYHITAVYDLTPYGFAGQTGESMIEGPVSVDVSYGYPLPFNETFTTGLFETNKWTVNGGNWHIAGQAGNPAPAAEFTYAPAVTGYDQSITSFYLIGTGITDGSVKLDFDLKHTLVNASETEVLAVEINNGNGWMQVAQFKNTENLAWETKSIDVSSRAIGHVFRIRFVAKGENTLNINNWLIDNVHVYHVCEAPTNLVAEVNTPHNDQIKLTWEGPNTPGPGISDWLFWDNGTNVDAIGLTGGGTFSVAVRFTPEQLAAYAGTSLTKIRMFPYQAGGSLVLKVWTGANASNLVLQQPIASYNGGVWNEFALNTPVAVSGTTELWFGYTVTHPDQVYIAGVDEGPAVSGYGDLLSTDGSVWESMSAAYGINNNWNLQGWVESLDGANAPLMPVADNSSYSNSNNVVRGFYPTLNTASLSADSFKNTDELTGYNVYRNGELIATTAETSYVDADEALIMGIEYCYKVTAVYESCESDFSNEDCEYITSVETVNAGTVNVYPNPSSSIVNIELPANISQFVIFNYTGQVVMEQNVAKAQTVRINVENYDAGAYLIKFTTRSGESFTKKIAVTK